MNTEILQKVADWLAAGAPHVEINDGLSLVGFNFGRWIHRDYTAPSNCGTMACIAGAIVEFDTPDLTVGQGQKLYSSKWLEPHYSGDTGAIAQQIAGITDNERMMLFYPFEIENIDLPEQYYDDERYDDEEIFDWTLSLEPEAVAKVLQHFINTREINWELAR